VKLHGENVFDDIKMSAKDTLTVTYNHYDRDKTEWSRHQVIVPPEKERVFNVLRVYTTDEFDGVTDAVVCVLGYKKKDARSA
jgi:hypothetical protein